MGRRKQARPHRSGGLIIQNNAAASASAELKNQRKASSSDAQPTELVGIDEQPYFVEVERDSWASNHHRDASELVLHGLNLRQEYSSFRITDGFYHDSKYSLRFRVSNVKQSVLSRIKLGHWPVFSSSDISLELIEKSMVEEDREVESVIFSGSFDGPDEGITGLVHLTNMEFLTLRPVLGVDFSEKMTPLRMRVEILEKAFDACESLLESTRQIWKKSMMNVMAWLRPEVMTSEARYRHAKSTEMEVNMAAEIGDDTSNSGKRAQFDVAGLYEAIKPSKSDPMLEDDLPDLLPTLRPYQRRAAHWMVQQEKGESSSVKERSQFFSPLCMPVDFLDTCSKMFYNPFSGNVSLHPEFSPPYVSGGILADEMGLGKTVELLACILAHRKSTSDDGSVVAPMWQNTGNQKINLKRLKRERVECVCGAVSDSYKYRGLWVQCDICDAWQHADCVGYSPRGKKKMSVDDVQKHRNKTTISYVERDGEHVCQMCSELIEVADTPIATGATLIVCPAPILPQWHSEIKRHTRPGSLKTYVYEGVRDASLSNTFVVDIGQLVNADIVLTTYDVLKEDLSHDSDRHEGDRHILRFQKRYPVTPTILTRIFWWRVCLDEAQMVESNAAAATEMALRLSTKYRWCITGTPIQRKLDDLYGLLRFLKASPFNVSRWWIDVIRDPYERRDADAMEFTHKFFKQIMWRSSKIHVADELQLPPQEECVSWLTFSAIEKHFYQMQHETCVSYAREVIGSFKDVVKRRVPGCVSTDASTDPLITHAEAAKLLNSLLKLRQACCHPQVGSSGLRSLQQSPMTMEEILMVLVGKMKIEGEEALRKLVVALNALAGIAILEQNFPQAVSLYKEALALSQEHREDFRLDPLLNIHIHHNLADILALVMDRSTEVPSNGQQLHGNSEKASKINKSETCDLNDAKKQKVSGEDSDFTIDAGNSLDLAENCSVGNKKGNNNHDMSSTSFSTQYLRTACENFKQKYLSVFSSKLSAAQLDFNKSYTQVCNAFGERKNLHTVWWLDALNHAEQNKDSTGELIRKIEEAVSGTLNNSRSSRIASRLRSITGLKYHIQTHLDQLEASRQTLLDRILEIDQTMANPKEEDIERVRHCRICQAIDDGPTCVHCELEESFQEYEARLFRLNKLHGGIITSAEEAVNLQKRNSERNRYYWNLDRQKKNLLPSSDFNEELKKRKTGETVMVSKSPSELEVILGVIKSYCKAQLENEAVSAASLQIHILEGMRKEYGHARSLAVAQAQLLRAHDELKMATARLHLRENENDMSMDALGEGELESASVLHSNEKFMSLNLLSHAKGKLRYLKGLVQSKQKPTSESSNNSSLTEEMAAMPMTTEKISEYLPKDDDEACPICQEKLNNQKMVFPCGHVTCCKCFFAMTERKMHDNRFQRKCLLLPSLSSGESTLLDENANDELDLRIASVLQSTGHCYDGGFWSDLSKHHPSDKKRHVAIVTTASLPWMTGTAVNPLFRAAYLAKSEKQNVTLLVPWLCKSDQELVYPNNLTFTSPEEQENYIRNWLEERIGFKADFKISFYPGKFAKERRSIIPAGDTSQFIPSKDADIAILEEPEHLNWYHHGKRWTTKFNHVVGVVHTNYLEYIKREKNGALQAFFVKHINNLVTRAYCHKVLRLSAATQDLPKSVICNVHGVNPKFLKIGEKVAAESELGQQAFSKGAYFLGKMVWAKGYKELIDLLAKHKNDLDGFNLDVFGNGEDANEVQTTAKRLDLNLNFLKGRDHADDSLHGYKVFINPSLSDVLCTATAEALAMGKFVVCADHPSNEYFRSFPNCLTYKTSEDFVARVKEALANEPHPLTPEQIYNLSWEAATQRFMQYSELDRVLDPEKDDVKLSKTNGRSITKAVSTPNMSEMVDGGLAFAHYCFTGNELLRLCTGAIPGTRDYDKQHCKDLHLLPPQVENPIYGW